MISEYFAKRWVEPMSLNPDHDNRPKSDRIRTLAKRKQALRLQLKHSLREWIAGEDEYPSESIDDNKAHQDELLHLNEVVHTNQHAISPVLRGGIDGFREKTPLIPTDLLSDMYIENQMHGILQSLRSIVQEQIDEKVDDDYIRRSDALWEAQDASFVFEAEHTQEVPQYILEERRKYVNTAVDLYN